MRTLLVGNTGYITNKFVEEAFPESLVMVMGDTSIRKNRKTNLFVRPFVKNEKELKIKKDKKERQRTWETNLKILKWKHHH